MRIIRRIIIHATGGPSDQPTQNILAHWRRLGWNKANGYHWLVGGRGLAERLQGDHLPSNGVVGFNSDSINLCYKGGWNLKDTRTEEQKLWLEIKIQEYLDKYPTITEVVGHRDLSPDLNGNGIIEPHEFIKACPCFNAREEYKHLLLTNTKNK